MIIGGIAVIARGVRRMTTDIDATVKGDQADVASLVRALAKKRIVPRIDNAERFASESLVLLLRHDPTGVEFDVSMAWTDFEHAAIAASSVAAFGVVKAPMARPEDLIVQGDRRSAQGHRGRGGAARPVPEARPQLAARACEPARSARG